MGSATERVAITVSAVLTVAFAERASLTSLLTVTRHNVGRRQRRTYIVVGHKMRTEIPVR